MKAITRAEKHCFLIVAIFSFLLAQCAAADDPDSGDGWQFSADAYLWGANIDIKNADGTHSEIRFTDLVENLDFSIMGGFGAQRGNWSLLLDAIYLDVDEGVNDPLALPGATLNNIELEAWILTPLVGYRVFQTDKNELELVTGARMLWLDAQLKIEQEAPLPPGSSFASDDGSNWDALAGIRGRYRLNDRWYLPYYFDIGAGDSDKTLQALLGVAYQFSRVDLKTGYRYLEWDLDKNADTFDKLDLSGPFAGVKILF